MVKTLISNWGNYPKVNGREYLFTNEDELKQILLHHSELIPRGLGRSYGDASLAECMVNTTSFNSILSFDPETGLIICQSGISLADILSTIIPTGWFLPVTPGTKFITLGGAVAADIHGKNHHKDGSFSNFIQSFRLMLENGEVIQCSRVENEALYFATIGGMGLTGIILDAELQLRKIETSFIVQHIKACTNLEEMMIAIDESINSTYSVAWLDCFANNPIGKGILFTGEHALLSDLDDKKKNTPFALSQKEIIRIPFYFPSFVLNQWTIRCFNWFYFRLQKRKKKKSVISYDQFFYPLDGLRDWNKIYGRPGFIQYQMVLPKRNSHQGLTQLLDLISKSGYGSFLSVLKLLGPSAGTISFPEEGYTLAMDFPAKDNVFKLVKELDKIVTSYEGKIYMAKDACLEEQLFRPMYPQLTNFKKVCQTFNPSGKFKSLLSKRLDIFK